MYFLYLERLRVGHKSITDSGPVYYIGCSPRTTMYHAGQLHSVCKCKLPKR